MKTKTKILSVVLVLVVGAVLLSGCGGIFANKSQWGAVSGSAVSGSAVLFDRADESEKKNKSSRMSFEDHQFCSANCVYMADDDNQKLIQFSVKTNQEKTYRVEGLIGLLLVEKDRIYYTKSFWNGENDEEEPEDLFRVCSMPIVSEADGSEKPLVEKEERLEYIPDLGISYDNFYPEMDEESFYYMPYDSGELIRYDRKAGYKEIVPVPPGYYGYLYNKQEKWICFFEEDIVDTLGVWNRKTNKVTEIKLQDPEGDDCESSFAFHEDAVYYSWYRNGDQKQPEVKCVDLSTKTTSIFVTEQEIKSVLFKKAGIKETSVRSCDMELTVAGNRLYLTLFLKWNKGRCLHIQEMVLSRELKQGSELKYEKELTECVQKHGKIERGALKKFDNYSFYDDVKKAGGIDEICYNQGSFVFFGEERAYLNWNPDEIDNEEYIMVDRKTGKCKRVKKGMPEYYELYYD